MKLSNIQVEKSLLETVVETPALNDVQRDLTAALAWFGPNGERWHKGGTHVGEMRAPQRACAGWVIAIVAPTGGFGWPRRETCRAFDALAKAVHEHPRSCALSAGLDHVAYWNDNVAKDFSEVRDMFLRAIDLAA